METIKDIEKHYKRESQLLLHRPKDLSAVSTVVAEQGIYVAFICLDVSSVRVVSPF